MRRFALLLLTLAAVLAAAPAADAQADPAARRVVLVDGTVLVGTVANENADPIVVITRDGVEQRIARSRVAEITPLIAGRFSRVDPTRTRLAFSPTARTLGRAGTARLGLSLYIFPSLTYAVTDRVDVTGSAFYVFGGGGGLLIGGAKGQLLDGEALDVALGFSAVAPITGESAIDGAIVALPYVVATIGSDVASANLGVTGFVGGDISSGDFDAAEGVVLSVGGERQMSNSLKLLGEILVPVGSGGDAAVGFVPGVRFFGDRFSADLYGVFGTDGTDSGGFAPFVNFGLTF
jgi:hypothetical protein